MIPPKARVTTRRRQGRVRRRSKAAAFAVLSLFLLVLRPGPVTAVPETPQEEAQAEAAPQGTLHPDLQEEPGAKCADCHGELLEGAVQHAPAESGDCESCHAFAGSGETRTVSPAMPMEELCVTCHSDQAAEIGLATVHGAVGVFGCPGCHNPHSSPNARLLRKPGNDLCLECHGGASGERPADAEGKVLLFESRPVEAALFDRISKLRLREDRGHPVGGHPVAAAKDPLRPDAPFGCVSCHSPHGSDRKGLLVVGATGSSCLRCHRK